MTLLERTTAEPGARRAAETEHRLRLADGRTLACLELGDPSGPPVLYFPGEGHLSLVVQHIGEVLAEPRQ